MELGLLIDFIVLVLLVAAVFYAARLHRQLGVFRADKDDFIRAIADFKRSTDAADATLKGLKFNADDLAAKLGEEIKEAQKLFDELHFMNDAGNNLAARLEKLAEKANKAHLTGAEPLVADNKTDTKIDDKAAAVKKAKTPLSKAEEDLMKALNEKKKK